MFLINLFYSSAGDFLWPEAFKKVIVDSHLDGFFVMFTAKICMKRVFRTHEPRELPGAEVNLAMDALKGVVFFTHGSS
jgi:hypothetical protein